MQLLRLNTATLLPRTNPNFLLGPNKGGIMFCLHRNLLGLLDIVSEIALIKDNHKKLYNNAYMHDNAY